MKPLSPALMIATAQAFVGLQSPALAQAFLSESAVPGAEAQLRWDAAFVSHVGYWAHWSARGRQSSWPLSFTARVDVLALEAAAGEGLSKVPEPGDLFLLASPVDGAFVRTGIVLHVGREQPRPGGGHDRTCHTIEGDTDPDLCGVGGWVLAHTRRLSADRGDRFIRWTALGVRRVAARAERRRREGAVGAAAAAVIAEAA